MRNIGRINTGTDPVIGPRDNKFHRCCPCPVIRYIHTAVPHVLKNGEQNKKDDGEYRYDHTFDKSRAEILQCYLMCSGFEVDTDKSLICLPHRFLFAVHID